MILNKDTIDKINPSGDKPIRWISFQSLAGGNMCGAEAAFGCPPLCTIDLDGIEQAKSIVQRVVHPKSASAPHILLPARD